MWNVPREEKKVLYRVVVAPGYIGWVRTVIQADKNIKGNVRVVQHAHKGLPGSVPGNDVLSCHMRPSAVNRLLEVSGVISVAPYAAQPEHRNRSRN